MTYLHAAEREKCADLESCGGYRRAYSVWRLSRWCNDVSLLKNGGRHNFSPQGQQHEKNAPKELRRYRLHDLSVSTLHAFRLLNETIVRRVTE